MVMIAEAPRRARRASANVVDEAAGGGGKDGENVGEAERWASLAGGAALALYGLRRRDWAGLALALAGAVLVDRARTGHCPVYGSLGLSSAGGVPRRLGRGSRERGDVTSAAATVNARKAVKVERSVTINRPAQELYDFWRDFEQLPRFMTHLESVTVLDDRRSHWVAKAPAGTEVEWDAEIINEIPGQLIAWKSVAPADVANAGSVHFQTAPGGRGTEVKVVLDYEPPAGRLGAIAAKLLHEEPDTQVREDLRRFKQLMEAGEVPTTEGQPAGRR
jgi:uncharacterized membrane protein